MGLLRLTGPEGTRIYDTNKWTREEAKEDYIDSTGEEADEKVQVFCFDVCTGSELDCFIKFGTS